jgi:homoserine dehydrogenase
VLNAVLVEGDAVGPTMYYGPGAGSEATASSVIADIVDIAREIDNAGNVPHLGYSSETENLPVLPVSDIVTGYYLRITVKDEIGQMANITRIMSEKGINIEAIIQKKPEDEADVVPLILLTHPVREYRMDDAISAIQALESVTKPIVRIRVEQLDG